MNTSSRIDGRLVIVFVKNPVPGQVKTRFAPELSHRVSADIYRCFADDVLATLDATGLPLQIAYHPPDAGESIRKWLGGSHRLVPQSGRDLGERMAKAFYVAFQEDFDRVALIGSDLPDLTPQILDMAFEELNRHDAVIGPAVDGGYYLIGFRRQGFHRDVFRNVDWSTSRVLQQTKDNLIQLKRSVSLLPEMRDIDTFDDLMAFMARPHEVGAAPATRECLRKLFPNREISGEKPQT